MKDLRIGQGFDVHALVGGRRLIVGGVAVPYEKGLAGHSDGDVLLHAIMDALLGAAGLPDIGQQFPPADDRYRDADSAILLGQVMQLIIKAGFGEIVNIDAIIVAQQPMFSRHRTAMRQRIAEVLSIDPSRINIKATTTEHLGFLGRGEGVAASAVCLLCSHE